MSTTTFECISIQAKDHIRLKINCKKKNTQKTHRSLNAYVASVMVISIVCTVCTESDMRDMADKAVGIPSNICMVKVNFHEQVSNITKFAPVL